MKPAKAGKPPEAIFLTGRFRSGTTLLWNIFRNLPQCCAYYEPLNDNLPTYIQHRLPVAADHIGVQSYWDEYFPIEPQVAQLHSPLLACTRLALEASDDWPELEKYLRFLIEAVPQKIPVLGFCRADFRLPWLMKKFPSAKIVHIHRDPQDQWMSMVKNLPPDRWNRADENTNYDLIAWSCALWKELPFLASSFVKNLYQRHFLLWRLSKLMGQRLADFSIDYDRDLLSDPRGCIARMLETLGLTGDVDTLAALVAPARTNGAWREHFRAEDFQAAEKKCDKLLKRLGLLENFGVKALDKIVARRAKVWRKLRDASADEAIDRAMFLFAQTRGNGTTICHSLLARIRMTDTLYNVSKGGTATLPWRAVETKYLGKPDENRKLAAEERAAGRIVLESLPPITTFALTTCCNNRRPCLICDRNVRPPEGDFDTNAAVVRAMEPLIRTASVLLLHTGGEAMMSKYYDDVIDMVNPPTEVTFATNAMLMNHKRADRMLARPIMCKIVVSLDAATSEIYRIHRPGSKFETVVDNVKYYIAQARSLGRKKAQVELNMTVCKSNLRDVPKLVDLAVEVGASGISFQRLNSGLSFVLKTVDGDTWDYKDQSTFENPSVVDRTILDTYRLAKQAGLEVSYMGSFLKETVADPTQADAIKELTGKIPFDEEGKFHNHPEEEGLARCLKRWEEVCVMPDGNVRACYYHLVPQYVVGNVIDQDFMAIWNSDLMIQERAMVVMNRWPASCLKAPAICSHRGRV